MHLTNWIQLQKNIYNAWVLNSERTFPHVLRVIKYKGCKVSGLLNSNATSLLVIRLFFHGDHGRNIHK